MKLNPKVFKKAAEFCFKKHDFNFYAGCLALERSLYYNNITYENFNVYKLFFQNLYAQNNPPYWFGERTQENAEIRAIALLLCAELCKEQDINE